MVAFGPAPSSSPAHHTRTLAEVEEAERYDLTIEQYHELLTAAERRWREKVRSKVKEEERGSLRRELRREVKDEVKKELRDEFQAVWTEDKEQELRRQIQDEDAKRPVTEENRAQMTRLVTRLRYDSLVVAEAARLEAIEADRREARVGYPLIGLLTLTPILAYLALRFFDAFACIAVVATLALLAKAFLSMPKGKAAQLRGTFMAATEQAAIYDRQARVTIPMATYISELEPCGKAPSYNRVMPGPEAMAQARQIIERQQYNELDTDVLLAHASTPPRLPG